MDWNPIPRWQSNHLVKHKLAAQGRRAICWLPAACACAFSALICSPALAQIRGKKPDRGVYQPPLLESKPLQTVELEPLGGDASQRETSESRLRPVAFEDAELVGPGSLKLLPAPIVDPHSANLGNDDRDSETVAYNSSDVFHDDGYVVYEDHGAMPCDGSCELGCDSFGCDSAACDSLGGFDHSWSNSSLCFARDNWFGSVELLLMFRRGDRFPALVTTGPGDAGAANDVLLGGQSVLKDMTAGGRVTLGTWIDPARCRSLVFRGWAAGEEDFDFVRDQSTTPIIGRPFRNVTDPNAIVDPDVQIISGENTTAGSIAIEASSNVYGADVAVRQYWYGAYGGSVDLLYGYQFMRVDSDLRIATETLSNDGTFLAVNDRFDAENEFHGGQFGIASHYREGCWSFNSLAKVGFGSLRRQATRSGSTRIRTLDEDFDPVNGLLVRNTNAGTTTDHTFGWVPELDFSLGYHRFPNYELTVGYHIIAMTDALPVSGTIDPDLSVNFTPGLGGELRPEPTMDFETFYVQGIHFGLQYVY